MVIGKNQGNGVMVKNGNAATSFASVTLPTLKKGSKGTAVRQMQTQLNSLGFYNKRWIDGDYGSATQAAVKRFQKANGLKQTGIADSKTRALLQAKVKGTSSTVIAGTKPAVKSSTSSHEIGRWNGHKFVVSASLIRSFADLTIKGSSELQDKKNTKQGYVSRKGANATEISLTVYLAAAVGVDVRTEAMALVQEARDGKADYFYIANKKLVSYKLMLTNADADTIELSQSGKWKSAKVKLTLKQSTKSGSDSSSSSGSSKNKSGSGRSSVRSSGVSSGGSSYRSSGSSGSGGYSAAPSNAEVDAISSAAPTRSSVQRANSAMSRNTKQANKNISSARNNRIYNFHAKKADRL